MVHVFAPNDILNEINRRIPDMIIAETNMAGLNGIELCRRLRSDGKLSGIPVVIISIDGTIKTRQDAHEAGCIDYLTKPVTARSIHELMERHLPYHHKRNNIRARMNVNATIIHGAGSVTMNTLSISEGGIYACTPHPFKVGSIIGIILPLPGLMSPIELKGEVIYTLESSSSGLPEGMGIKFTCMDNNTVTLLRHYMESYVSDYVPETFPDE